MRIVVGIDGLRLQTRDCVKFLRLWSGWFQIISIIVLIKVIMAVVVIAVINNNRNSSHNHNSNTIVITAIIQY